MKSTTRDPFGSFEANPCSRTPRPLPGLEPISTRLKQCPSQLSESTAAPTMVYNSCYLLPVRHAERPQAGLFFIGQ